MNDKSQAVSVSILDKEYKIACPTGEQKALIESAKEVDLRMRKIRKSGKVLNADRISVMVALNLAHELLNVQTQVDNIDSTLLDRIDKIQAKINTTMEACTDNEKT